MIVVVVIIIIIIIIIRTSSRANTLCTCLRFYRHFMLELISLLVNPCFAAFKWPIHVFYSFYSLESSVLSVKKILSRWAAMRGAANNEFIDRNVTMLERNNSRMIVIL